MVAEGDTKYFANVVETGGDVHTVPLRGAAPDRKAVMDPNGVVYQPTYDQDTGNTYVAVVDADGTVQETAGIPGQVSHRW